MKRSRSTFFHSSFSTLLAAWAVAAIPTACSAEDAARIAVPEFELIDRIEIGGAPRWDYLTVDSVGRRLYLSHATQTEVVDLQTGRKIGAIANTPGVHGIAIARDLGLGFISDGRSDTVTVFDLDSLAEKASIKVGGNPDAIVYEPDSQRIVTFNGRTRDATVIDAKSKRTVATVPLGGKPEYAQVGEGGSIFLNIEDTNELLVFDAASAKVLRRHSLEPCDGPSGLAIDASHRVYSVCENRIMVVSDERGGQLAHVPIGAGSDGVAWAEGFAFSANGSDGTISVVSTQGARIETVATIRSAIGARTIATDSATGRLYLPTADFKPAAAEAAPGARRIGIEGTLHILVFARKQTP